MEVKHEYLTVQEAADLMRVTPETVSRMCRQGELPAGRIGTRWRIRRETLEKLLSATNVSDGWIPGVPRQHQRPPAVSVEFMKTW